MLTTMLRENERALLVSSFVYSVRGKKVKKVRDTVIKYSISLGGFATSVDVPMLAHGLIFCRRCTP